MTNQPPAHNPHPPRARRPPLAEVDAEVLAAALAGRRWGEVGPWAALLAGFGLVLAGMISFFWLSAQISGHPEDVWIVAPLALGLGWFLWTRFRAEPRLAATLIGALGVLTLVAVAAWLLFYQAVGGQVWLGLGGVLLVCGLGIGVGLLGLNRLGGGNA
jgi:hypothetical protein